MCRQRTHAHTQTTSAGVSPCDSEGNGAIVNYLFVYLSGVTEQVLASRHGRQAGRGGSTKEEYLVGKREVCLLYLFLLKQWD